MTKPTNEPFFEVAEDAGQWHWVLWSANGQMIARNAASYGSLKDAQQSIRAVAGAVVKAKQIVRSQSEE
jgi:uncharacterized protein YegP (UPF0339 family)